MYLADKAVCGLCFHSSTQLFCPCFMWRSKSRQILSTAGTLLKGVRESPDSSAGVSFVGLKLNAGQDTSDWLLFCDATARGLQFAQLPSWLFRECNIHSPANFAYIRNQPGDLFWSFCCGSSVVMYLVAAAFMQALQHIEVRHIKYSFFSFVQF